MKDNSADLGRHSIRIINDLGFTEKWQVRQFLLEYGDRAIGKLPWCGQKSLIEIKLFAGFEVNEKLVCSPCVQDAIDAEYKVRTRKRKIEMLQKQVDAELCELATEVRDMNRLVAIALSNK